LSRLFSVNFKLYFKSTNFRYFRYDTFMIIVEKLEIFHDKNTLVDISFQLENSLALVSKRFSSFFLVKPTGITGGFEIVTLPFAALVIS